MYAARRRPLCVGRRFTRSVIPQRAAATKTCGVTLFANAKSHGDRRAIISARYKDLLRDSATTASILSPKDLKEERVAFLTPPDYSYPMAQWGIWRAGGVAVPLSPSHPPAELDYVVRDSASSTLLCHPSMERVAAPIAKANNAALKVLPSPATTESEAADRFDVHPDRNAMIIYTSGTTGKPKGVVTTHKNIEAQVQMLVEAWGWTSNDHILQVLPLHHVHGIVAVLLSSLWAGATCEMQLGFNAADVWERLMKSSEISLFMAVPTIYSKLVSHSKQVLHTPEQKQEALNAFQRLRLMVSGSAALPQPLFEEWEKISGHRLLERYGMTELGLVISNPLHGERRPGFVGRPLRGVDAKIIVPDNNGEREASAGEEGELRVRGASVFKEYWRRPDATRESFDEKGYFKTGDIATTENGMIKILGRASVDIIKTGGYKVSALDVERTLLAHPAIGEVAVVGLKDAEFGQKIAAIVVPKSGEQAPDLETLREWAKKEMAVYKAPKVLKVLAELPRNNMGKVNKKELALKVFGEKI